MFSFPDQPLFQYRHAMTKLTATEGYSLSQRVYYIPFALILGDMLDGTCQSEHSSCFLHHNFLTLPGCHFSWLPRRTNCS